MQHDLEIKPGLVIPAHELELSSSRASGPGGQHVNKTNSRVTLRWNVQHSNALKEYQRRIILEKLSHRISRGGFIQVDAEQSRKQLQNRDFAREKLAQLIRDALHRPRKRKATKPSRGARERRLKSKKRRSEIKASRSRRHDD